MELDNLKNSWNSVSAELNKNEFDIISATKKEMESPLSKLKKTATKQTKVLPALFAFLIVLMVKTPELKTSLFMWMALIILPLTTIYYYFNLRVINRLEQNNGSVKHNIKDKIQTLIKSNNAYLISTRILMIFLVIAIEILLRYNRFDLMVGLENFKNVLMPWRFLAYAGIIGLHYLISRYTFNSYFGEYLNRLKIIVAEM